MILPTRKFILLLLLPAALLFLWPSELVVTLVLSYDGGLVLLALLDLAISPRPAQIEVTRQTPALLSLGTENQIGWVFPGNQALGGSSAPLLSGGERRSLLLADHPGGRKSIPRAT